MKAIKDPDNKRYKEILEWVGDEFDPEHFDVKEVVFGDPDKRLKDLFR